VADTTDTQGSGLLPTTLGFIAGLTHDQLGRAFGSPIDITGPTMTASPAASGASGGTLPDAPVPSSSQNPGTDLKSQIEWELSQIEALLEQAASEGRGLTDDEQAAADDSEQKAANMSRVLEQQFAANLRRAQADALFAKQGQSIRGVVEGHAAAESVQFSQQPQGGNGGAGVVSVGATHTPYDLKSQYSFFGDLAKFAKGDRSASGRLDQHRAYVDENKKLFSIYEGQYGGQELTPPIYLQNLFELAVVQVATTAALANSAVSLPETGRSFTVPKMTAGATAAQYTSASSLNNISDTDPTFDVATANIVPIAGQVSMDRFLRDRGDVGGAVDVMIGQHLAETIASTFDKYVLSTIDAGATTNIAYAQDSPTFGLLYPKLANLIQSVHTLNAKSIDAIVVAPRRFGDWISATDANGRPLLVPTPAAFNPLAQGSGVEGLADVKTGFTGYSIANIPVYVDGNITTTNNTSQDVVYGFDSNKLYAPKSSVGIEIDSMFAQNKFGVMVTGFIYAAALVAHRPMAFGRVTGTGLVTPTF
jgi:hypothetical protein